MTPHRTRKVVRLLLALYALAALPRGAAAEDADVGPCGPVAHLDAEGDWQALREGVEVRRLSLWFALDPREARLLLLRLEPGRLRIRVVALRREGGDLQTVPGWGRRTGALAVVNGGYFTPEGKPLGLFISDGRVVNRQLLGRGGRGSLHYGAVFEVRGGRAAIVGRDEFDLQGVDQALQAGPRLIEKGRPSGGLGPYRENARLDQRAALALDARGRVVLFVTEGGGRGLSWCEMQRFLLLAPERGGVGAREAMNLDGGSSAQLYLRAGGVEREVGGRPIPAAIAFYPRPEEEPAPR